MKRIDSQHLIFALNFLVVTAFTTTHAGYVIAQTKAQADFAADRYLSLPIAKGDAASPRMLYRYGVPFMETNWHASANGPLQVNVGAPAKRIFLLGMTETQRPAAWSDPLTYASRYFVGDNLGTISVRYADGSAENYPLLLGEGVWWGLPFYQAREPFPSDPRLRHAFEASLRLYPAEPVDDGNYVAVIVPKSIAIASIEIENSPGKHGSVAIAGITVEATQGTSIPGTTPIPFGEATADFAKFAKEKSLRLAGKGESEAKARLTQLSDAFYSTEAVLKQPIAEEVPGNYSGPRVRFRGTNEAVILENAFYANVLDMLSKVDADGTYHTSTHNALSWAGDPRSAGGEFGTFRKDVGVYYAQAWSRDFGRTMQELTELGFLSKTAPAADFALKASQHWTEDPTQTYKGTPLPPHWSRIMNGKPDFGAPFENDGHGLIAMFLYKLWQRTPDRDAWLREHWAEVNEAGHWIPWQFDHPDITSATNGVLYTTGESAGGKGYSVYADYVCMEALLALSQMADSVGETQSAVLWRDRAAKMRVAMLKRYVVDDAKYGKVWTLDHAGWPNKSTVLGPMIFLADYSGFAPQDDDPAWRPINLATYQRLVDTYRPFGFYGWAMGYGQGFVTQAALLLDRMKDATPMLEWTAREVWDPQIHSFVVPEGVQVDPSGKYIFRTGDQGNGVQEAEIVKLFRILLGVDDTDPHRLQVFPRIPYGWNELGVSEYPALVNVNGEQEIAHVRYDLRRISGRMSLDISADRPLGEVAVRLGPFDRRPKVSDVLVNGREPGGSEIQMSGDSWWVSFKANIGLAPADEANMKKDSRGD